MTVALLRTRLDTELTLKLGRVTSVADEPEAVGSTWDTLLEQLLDVALDYLASCMNSSSRDQIAIAELSPGHRWVLRGRLRRQTDRAAREDLMPEKTDFQALKVLEEVTITVANDFTEVNRRSIMAEIKSLEVDWAGF